MRRERVATAGAQQAMKLALPVWAITNALIARRNSAASARQSGRQREPAARPVAAARSATVSLRHHEQQSSRRRPNSRAAVISVGARMLQRGASNTGHRTGAPGYMHRSRRTARFCGCGSARGCRAGLVIVQLSHRREPCLFSRSWMLRRAPVAGDHARVPHRDSPTEQGAALPRRPTGR